jgi:hypothetical protein
LVPAKKKITVFISIQYKTILVIWKYPGIAILRTLVSVFREDNRSCLKHQLFFLPKNTNDNTKKKKPRVKRRLLDELDFGWRSAVGQKIDDGSRGPRIFMQCEKSSIDTAWMARYRELKKFKAENGHLHQAASRTPMSNWIYKQRHSAKKGVLSAKRRELLNRLGFEWTSTPVISSSGPKISMQCEKYSICPAWIARYNELKNFQG